MTFWRCEFEASHFEQLTVRVTEVNRIHEATVNIACVLDTALLQALRNLCICCARNVVSDVMQISDILWIRRWVVDTRRADKERDQSSIARIKVEMHFIWHIEVGLLEDEWHPQYTLIEIDDGFAIGTDKCNVVHTLSLNFAHEYLSISFTEEFTTETQVKHSMSPCLFDRMC